MIVGRSAAVKFAALCLLAAPAVVLADGRPAPRDGGRTTAQESRESRRGDRLLTKIIVGGGIAAVAGALGSLRKRSGGDTTPGDDGAGA